MILFQLSCRGGHQFEAWFRDGATYDKQCETGDVVCPYCGDSEVSKVPVAPKVMKSRHSDGRAEDRAKEVAEQILEAMSTLRKHVQESCDFVGEDFANEARRIHQGEAEERNIFGIATEEEASELEEEGIEYYRFPWFPRRNR